MNEKGLVGPVSATFNGKVTLGDLNPPESYTISGEGTGGPAGFATPDDCEALALCQRGYGSVGGEGWNDISKGYLSDQPQVDDEAQMRAFWREWHRRVTRATP